MAICERGNTHRQRQEADISTNKLPSNRPVREQLKSCNCRRRVRLRRRRRRVLHGWLNCCLCQPVVLPVDCCQLPVVSVAARSANTNSTYLFTYPHLPLPPPPTPPRPPCSHTLARCAALAWFGFEFWIPIWISILRLRLDLRCDIPHFQISIRLCARDNCSSLGCAINLHYVYLCFFHFLTHTLTHFTYLYVLSFVSDLLIQRLSVQQVLEVSSEWKTNKSESQYTWLEYDFRVTCDPHYYGSGCANLCRPRDDQFGHYTCSETGEIICLTGWQGTYCEKRK